MAPSRAFPPVRNICSACLKQRLQRRSFLLTPISRSTHDALPRVAAPSFWSGLIPKPFRRNTDPTAQAAKSKQWNPFTIFILLGIVVGSNAIQIIALRNEMLSYSRKTEAKLALLREVVQRVKAGEDVDVKRVLGTGDASQEAEWEEVIKELETADALEEGRRKREARRAEKEEQRNDSKGREGPSSQHTAEAGDGEDADRRRRPKFLM